MKAPVIVPFAVNPTRPVRQLPSNYMRAKLAIKTRTAHESLDTTKKGFFHTQSHHPTKSADSYSRYIPDSSADISDRSIHRDSCHTGSCASCIQCRRGSCVRFSAHGHHFHHYHQLVASPHPSLHGLATETKGKGHHYWLQTGCEFASS